MRIELTATICSNAETVCDWSDPHDPEEVTMDAVGAAWHALEDAELPELPGGISLEIESNSTFRNWHGGRYYKKNLGYRRVHIDAHEVTLELDDDGEETGDLLYRWLRREEVPAAVVKFAAKLADAANEAMDEVLSKAIAEEEESAEA